MRFSSLLLLTCVLATPLMANGPNGPDAPEGALGGQPSASTSSASAAAELSFSEQTNEGRYQMVEDFLFYLDAEKQNDQSLQNILNVAQVSRTLVDAVGLFFRGQPVSAGTGNSFVALLKLDQLGGCIFDSTSNTSQANDFALGFGQAAFEGTNQHADKSQGWGRLLGLQVRSWGESFIEAEKAKQNPAKKEVDAQGVVVEHVD